MGVSKRILNFKHGDRRLSHGETARGQRPGDEWSSVWRQNGHHADPIEVFPLQGGDSSREVLDENHQGLGVGPVDSVVVDARLFGLSFIYKNVCSIETWWTSNTNA